MKLRYLFFIPALIALAGCSSDINDEPRGGDGSVSIELRMVSDYNSLSRAASDDAALLDGCTVSIANSSGKIRVYHGASTVPSQIWLPSGGYGLEVWAGDSVPASFTASYYHSCAPFEVLTGQNTKVQMTCRLANVLASVKYDDKIKEALSAYKVTIGHARGSLVYDGDDQRVGYYMMPSGVNTLDWTLEAVTKDGHSFIKSGKIRDVKSANEYRLSFTFSGELPVVGTVNFDVDVNADVEVISHDISFNAAPVITLDGMDINQTQEYTKGDSRRHAIVVQAAAGLASVKLSSDQFVNLGVEQSTFDVYHADSETISALYSKGINLVEQDNADDGSSVMVINFSKKLCDLLPVGDYNFTVRVVDRDNMTADATLRISILEPPAQ